MWHMLGRKKHTFGRNAHAPPEGLSPGDAPAPRVQGGIPAGSETGSPASTACDRARQAARPEKLVTLATLMAERIGPIVEDAAKRLTRHTEDLLTQNHEAMIEHAREVAGQITASVAAGVAHAAQQANDAVAGHITQMADHLHAAIEKRLADGWSALDAHLTQVCTATAQHAVLRPVIDQILALLDRIGGEREFLSMWYRKDPTLASQLGSRQVFERYNDAVQSFVHEIYILLRSLDVLPLNGCAGPFNPQQQKIVAVEPASKPELDGHVARIVRPGFVWRGVVCRYEEVVVYKKEKSHG